MSVAGSCGSEDLANDLLTALVAGKEFTFAPLDLDSSELTLPATLPGGDVEITHLTNAALTSGTVNGNGVFDVIMAGLGAHLKAEFEKGRITGEQYTRAYIELTTAALNTGVQFLLGKDQAYFGALQARFQAEAAQAQMIQAKVQLMTSKAQLQMIIYEAQTAEAAYALAKIKLSGESIGYCTAKFNLEQVLPAQKKLLDEQFETVRAQTLNTRSDGTAVVGTLGKQRDLYDQQITSYKRDAEVKVAKIFSDAWVTMKTLDEGLLPPNGFTNESLDTVLTGLKTNVDLAG